MLSRKNFQKLTRLGDPFQQMEQKVNCVPTYLASTPVTQVLKITTKQFVFLKGTPLMTTGNFDMCVAFLGVEGWICSVWMLDGCERA